VAFVLEFVMIFPILRLPLLAIMLLMMFASMIGSTFFSLDWPVTLQTGKKLLFMGRAVSMNLTLNTFGNACRHMG
jgi:hypothetical protein